MSAVSPLAEVDWPTVAAGIGIFIATIYTSLKGLQKGRAKVQSGESEQTAIVGASIIESSSIRTLSEQLRDNTVAVREQSMAIRENTSALNRNTDVEILTHRN